MSEFIFFLVQLCKSLIFPPGLFILLTGLLILLIYLNKRMLALSLSIATLCLLTLLSLPVVQSKLTDIAEVYPALTEEQINTSPAQAIVVLGGGRNSNAPEYGGQTVSLHSLRRVRYAARLYRQTQLPILVTGGKPSWEKHSESELMAVALKEDYSIAAKWIEDQSRNTAQNAAFSAPMLKADKIEHILLVTTAAHLARAVPLFEQHGFQVTPAPTAFEGTVPGERARSDFIPNINALADSYYALHEIIGRVYYKFRY